MRAVQPEHHRQRVRRLDAGDGRGEAGAGAGVEAQQHLLETDLHIGGGEGLAIMPAHARAQPEGHAQPIGRHDPGCREVGFGIAGLIQRDQPIEQRPRHGMQRPSRRNCGVEVARVTSDRDHGRSARGLRGQRP